MSQRNDSRNDRPHDSSDIGTVVPMTDHLPECPWPTEPCNHTPMQDREPPFCMDCLTECICDRLRACEQRVRLEDDDYAYVAAQAEAEGRIRGWNEALDAARKAVAAIKDEHVGDEYKYERLVLRVAQAAIDALRGKR